MVGVRRSLAVSVQPWRPSPAATSSRHSLASVSSFAFVTASTLIVVLLSRDMASQVKSKEKKTSMTAYCAPRRTNRQRQESLRQFQQQRATPWVLPTTTWRILVRRTWRSCAPIVSSMPGRLASPVWVAPPVLDSWPDFQRTGSLRNSTCHPFPRPRQQGGSGRQPTTQRILSPCLPWLFRKRGRPLGKTPASALRCSSGRSVR